MVRAPESVAGRGLLGSLRGLADGLIEGVRDRLELFALELHEEKFRVIQLFIWISAAIFSAILAITFASLTIVYLFWDTAHPTARGHQLLGAQFAAAVPEPSSLLLIAVGVAALTAMGTVRRRNGWHAKAESPGIAV